MVRHTCITCVLGVLLLSGCAVLHHAQVGEIDNSSGYELRPFDVKMSETGVNIQEAGRIAGAMSNSKKGAEDANNIAGIIGLFQMGPHTGNGVFSETYAKNVIHKIHEACPSGRVTGLLAVREMRKYPVISGEVVKVTGYCMMKKEKS